MIEEFLRKHSREVTGMLFNEITVEEFAEIRAREAYEDGEKSGFTKGETAGLVKGRSEGAAQEKREIAKNFRSRHSDGCDCREYRGYPLRMLSSCRLFIRRTKYDE